MKEDPQPRERHEGSFAQKLEARTRDLLVELEGPSARQWSPSSILEEEAALVLHQIDESCARERAAMDSLLQEECYIGTELLQMEQRTPRYSPYRFPEREKLLRRLGQLSQERRRFTIAHAERLDGLHNRLLELVGKHRQVTFTL